MASFAKAAPAGGYDIGPATVYSSQGPLKQPEILALTCSKCKFILREPKQVIVCGHRYCKLCIEQMTSGGYVFTGKMQECHISGVHELCAEL